MRGARIKQMWQRLRAAGCGEHEHTITLCTLRGPHSLRVLMADSAHACRVSVNQWLLGAVLDKIAAVRAADPLLQATSRRELLAEGDLSPAHLGEPLIFCPSCENTDVVSPSNEGRIAETGAGGPPN
jgi:hypothetical protein